MSGRRFDGAQMLGLAIYAGVLGFGAGVWHHRRDEERQELSRRLRAVERRLDPPDEHELKPMPVRIVEA
jgi:hypothetical protein